MIVVAVMCGSVFGQKVDCDTLTVRVLRTIYAVDTVHVVIVDTVRAPANVWNMEYLIVSRDPYLPNDTTAWHGEIWMYDSTGRKSGSFWAADLKQVGSTMENRIFRVDSTSLAPFHQWSGGLGAKQLFKRLNEERLP
jgi:hypothetical protein